MLIRMSEWEKIRDNFSEEEKQQLNNAIEGEVICPKGLIINEDILSREIKNKLNAKTIDRR